MALITTHTRSIKSTFSPKTKQQKQTLLSPVRPWPSFKRPFTNCNSHEIIPYSLWSIIIMCRLIIGNLCYISTGRKYAPLISDDIRLVGMRVERAPNSEGAPISELRLIFNCLRMHPPPPVGNTYNDEHSVSRPFVPC